MSAQRISYADPEGGRFNEQQDRARFLETLQQAGFVFPALVKRIAD